MNRWLTALKETTLFYRNNPAASWSQVAGLLGSGSVLLTLCRLPLGFSILTNVLLAALGQAVLMIGGLLFLLRGGTDPVSEALKLSRLILVTWMVCLILFVHNLLPSTRVLWWLSPEVRASVYALAATVFIPIHTIRVEKKRSPSGTVNYWSVLAGFLGLGLFLTVALYFFVLSEKLSEVVQEIVSWL